MRGLLLTIGRIADGGEWAELGRGSYYPPGHPATHYPEAELSADVADWKTRIASLLPPSDRLLVDELTTAHWIRKCYSKGALILWAAHLDHPEFPKPTRFPNKEGWRAAEEEWTSWSELAITRASSLETQAQQAFGAFADCAQKADSFALPLILVC